MTGYGFTGTRAVGELALTGDEAVIGSYIGNNASDEIEGAYDSWVGRN